LAPIVVRIDESFDSEQATFVEVLAAMTGAHISFSAKDGVEGEMHVVRESVDELVARSATFGKVRWLSREAAPVVALLDHGISTDRRAISQSGAVEGPT
jgi:Holliday junction resolvase